MITTTHIPTDVNADRSNDVNAALFRTELRNRQRIERTQNYCHCHQYSCATYNELCANNNRTILEAEKSIGRLTNQLKQAELQLQYQNGQWYNFRKKKYAKRHEV